MNEVNAIDDPRSTVNVRGVPDEHHLSVLPPDTDPLTALSAVSLALQVVAPDVAGRFSARFPPPGGGGEPPESYDGGASFAPVPHALADEPSVKSTVPPEVKMEPGIHVFVWPTPLTASDWMKKLLFDACGALMVMVLPFIRWISTWVNSGALSVTSVVPRFSG